MVKHSVRMFSLRNIPIKLKTISMEPHYRKPRYPDNVSAGSVNREGALTQPRV
jgi:hypothetical protein